MAGFVTMHKLFYLLPQHQGLINHGKLSLDSLTLNTNTGHPQIHGVVTRGLEYSCLIMPVHTLSQQPCFILRSSEGSLSICKVKWGLVLVCGFHTDVLFHFLQRFWKAQCRRLEIPLTPEVQTQKSLPTHFTSLDTQDLESEDVLQKKTQNRTVRIKDSTVGLFSFCH